MQNNIEAIGLNKICTGCGACQNTCPFNAIKLEANDEGFLVPTVNGEKCTNCGLCKTVCPAIHFKTTNRKEPECYAVLADSGIRRKSSSGGMFTILAQHVLKKGGYVCGAAFVEEWNVHHIIIDKEEDLDKLRRSKYLQSEMGDTYQQIKTLLDYDKVVLFVGTPCQVSALNLFLKKDYEKLIKIDLICHGVPNYEIFKKFLEEITPISNIKSINFREKERIGLDCFFSIETNDSKIYPQEYFSGFVNNLYLRKSCSACKYTGFQRFGDMTIGDFWGIENYDPSLYDKIGTSLVLINNAKGAKCFSEVKANLKNYKKTPTTIINKNYNPTLFNPHKAHSGRTRFFGLLKNRKFSDAFKFSIEDKYDVGIVGCGFSNNYGAILTNYALYEILKTFNLEPLMIDKPKMLTNGLFNDYHYTNTIARKFMNKYLNVSQIYNDEQDLKALNEKCGFFVVGSDQIWNNGIYPPAWYYYFLNWVSDSKKKIAYATSFGNDTLHFAEDEIRWNTSYFLKKFDAVSTREDSGVAICKQEYDVDACQNLDPVFLLDTSKYDDLIKNAKGTVPKENYITTYLLDSTEWHYDFVENVKDKLNMPSYNFIDLTEDGATIDFEMNNIFNNEMPEEFLKVFRNSKFIITNSFHGVCFSIIFNIPFICIPNKFRGFTRFKSLLKLFNLEDRMIETLEELQEKPYLLDGLDYSKVNKILEREKKRSILWLKNAINMQKNMEPSSFDYLTQKIHDETCSMREMQNENIKNLKFLRYKLNILLNKDKIFRRYVFCKLAKMFVFGISKKEYISEEKSLKKLLDDIKLMKESLI